MKPWLCLWCLLVPSVLGFSMPGNVSLNISGLNGSLSYPGGSYSFSTLNDVSSVFPFSLEMSGINMSLNLSPGNYSNVSGLYDTLELYCSMNASCVNSTVYVNQTVYLNQTPPCSRGGELHPGDSYWVNDSQCRLDFSCSSTLSTCSNNTFTINRSVDVSKDGDIVTMTLGNESSSFSLGITNASFSVPLSFSCPLQALDVNDTRTMDVFGICSAYFPQVMGFFNLTLNKCFNNFDDYKEYVAAHESVVQSANQALSDCRTNESMCAGVLNTQSAEIARLQQVVDNDADERQVLLVIAGLAMLAAVIGWLAFTALAHRAGAQG